MWIHNLVLILSNGSIYALIALALVMIHKSTGLINFAQGEMATFSTYICFSLITFFHLNYWVAFCLTLLLSFLLGLSIERFLIRPLYKHITLNHFSVITLFIGLMITFHASTGVLWGFGTFPFPSPFKTIDSHLISGHHLGIALLAALLFLALFLFFRYTSMGLKMRAAAQNPQACTLMGISVNQLYSLGWGLAAALGAIAGLLTAPMVFLAPDMMMATFIYGFAAALIGGLNSPLGATLGAFLLSTTEILIIQYIPGFGTVMKLPLALLFIVCLLILKPEGLFNKKNPQRV